MVFAGEDFACVLEHPNEQPLSGVKRGTVSVHEWMFQEQFRQRNPSKLEVLFRQYQRQRAANHTLAQVLKRSLTE